MTAVVGTLLNVAVIVFGVTSMLAVGLGHALTEIITPFRNVSGVLRTLVGNFVLVPLLAFIVVRLLSLEQPLAIGLMLVSMAAGAPFLIKLTAHAEHDVGFSATVLLLLLPATILYMPLVVPLVLPDAAVSAGAIARPLVVTMLLPLGIGFLVRAKASRWGERLLPVLGRASSVALIVLILATVAANFRGIVSVLGSAAIPAAALVVLGAFAIGYALATRGKRRGVLGLATAQRNIAAATVVATQTFEDPGPLIMAVITSLVALALLFPIASVLHRRVTTQE
jgi:BASS family bile acid:Na+ symporter